MSARAISELGGLLAFAALVAVLVGARRVCLRITRVRLQRAAARPLPGRTRDLTRRASGLLS